MTLIDDGPLARFSGRNTWQVLRNLFGGAVILVVWLALWGWVAAGVVGPLSTVSSLRASAIAAERA